MRTQLLVAAATMSLVVGCDRGRSDVLGQSQDRAGEEPTPAVYEDPGGACMAEECFLITADKDISFIAVEGAGCDGGALDLSLWTTGGDRIDIEPEPHGQGKSCEGISPDAMKFEGFEGIESRSYRLCVATNGSMTVGDLVVTTKAGRVCETFTHDGSCNGCGGSTGSGSTETTSSSSGGTDTVTVGVTASASVGAGGSGGAGTDTTASATVTVGVGGGEGGSSGDGGSSGEGGCGGDSAGEGGAATDTTTVAASSSSGGEGGCGGSSGDDGACDHDHDVGVDHAE